MKMVIQRVSRAEVRVDGDAVGRIGAGLAVLVGLESGDGEQHLERAARRLATLRIFSDDEGRMNRGLDEVSGAVLAVSQFTLAGSIRKGRRPSFDRALAGDAAEPLFNRFLELLREEGVTVETGVFGALMDVELVNDGPVTLIWEDAPDRLIRNSEFEFGIPTLPSKISDFEFRISDFPPAHSRERGEGATANSKLKTMNSKLPREGGRHSEFRTPNSEFDFSRGWLPAT